MTQEDFIVVRNLFEIDTLFPEQELEIKAFIERDNSEPLPKQYATLVRKCNM